MPLDREPIVDADWNEFDLDAVYRCVAPQLSKTDEGFAQGYEAMQKQVAEQGAVAESLVNRRSAKSFSNSAVNATSVSENTNKVEPPKSMDCPPSCPTTVQTQTSPRQCSAL